MGSDRIIYKIVFSREVGNIFHYGHFIVDAVIPFLHVYSGSIFSKSIYSKSIYSECINSESKTAQGSPETATKLLVADCDDQHMGNRFTQFFEKIFSVKVIYVHPDDFFRRDYPILYVKGLKFGPYPTEDLVWAEKHLGWGGGGGDHPNKKILIIDRGFRPIDVPAHCRANRNDTGNRRRRLENQREVIDCVQSFADRHCLTTEVVRLEEHSIETQMRYFEEAWIVIGQHGAGLCNLIFSHRNHGHVLEISHWGLSTIRNITKAKGWQHHVVKSSMRICDVNHLMDILTMIISRQNAP